MPSLSAQCSRCSLEIASRATTAVNRASAGLSGLSPLATMSITACWGPLEDGEHSCSSVALDVGSTTLVGRCNAAPSACPSLCRRGEPNASWSTSTVTECAARKPKGCEIVVGDSAIAANEPKTEATNAAIAHALAPHSGSEEDPRPVHHTSPTSPSPQP